MILTNETLTESVDCDCFSLHSCSLLLQNVSLSVNHIDFILFQLVWIYKSKWWFSLFIGLSENSLGVHAKHMHTFIIIGTYLKTDSEKTILNAYAYIYYHRNIYIKTDSEKTIPNTVHINTLLHLDFFTLFTKVC